jgi:VWFA-related protein
MPISGSTELFRAVTDMVPYMKDTPHRKRAMLLMTDGIDNSIIAASRDGRGDPFEAPGPLASSAKAQAALREGEVLLYALGINVAGRAGAVHVPSLQRLAEPTGGSVIIASTVREVEAAAQRVAEELRQQYTLGFYPQNAGDTTYHRLRVMTRHPDYRVRTRSGYLTANPK